MKSGKSSPRKAPAFSRRLFIGGASVPEVGFKAVGNEAERLEGLTPGNLGDVVPQLFLGFDNGENLAVCPMQNVVGDAIPRFGVVAVDGDFYADEGWIVDVPSGGF